MPGTGPHDGNPSPFNSDHERSSIELMKLRQVSEPYGQVQKHVLINSPSHFSELRAETGGSCLRPVVQEAYGFENLCLLRSLLQSGAHLVIDRVSTLIFRRGHASSRPERRDLPSCVKARCLIADHHIFYPRGLMAQLQARGRAD